MNKKEPPHSSKKETMPDEEINAQSASPEEGNIGEEETLETLEERVQDDVQQLEAELARMKDQLLRSLADMENLKKRSEREVRDMAKYAITEFARDLLSISDNLRRALDTVKEEKQVTDELLNSLVEGVKLTEKELLKAFQKHGIEKIEPKGEKFDHNYHQAIFEVDHDSLASGMVAEVMQPGYKLHDRLLRPAMVGVTKRK